MFFILRKTYDVKERRELLLSLFEIFDVEGIDSEKLMKGLKNETFRTVVGTPDYIIQPTNMNSQQRILHTHHPMFAPESGFYYEGCIGGKTEAGVGRKPK